MADTPRLALLASPTERAQEAEDALRASREWVPFEEADAVVALGGDGFMLQILHQMLERDRVIPAFGMNLGTVGFLMNRFKSSRAISERIAKARRIAVSPLWMEAKTNTGEQFTSWAINEVSLLRETRQTAKLEVTVNGKVRIPELSCDGVLVATPAGSTAYNLSAQGPIIPINASLLAVTPISPFRPRRWRGALLPDTARVMIRVIDPERRPVAAVADHAEVRSVRDVEIRMDHSISMQMLFDPGHSLDERILSEQFGH